MLLALAPVPALADDAARISRLETEIQQLRTLIDEQARRIRRLEDELDRRTGQPGPVQRPRPRAETTVQGGTPAPVTPRPWHGAAAWDRVATGMTQEEVAQVLGEPTSADSIGALSTLFYNGPAPGGRPLRGHVNLKDGRVVAVSKPSF